ncbi:MAG TPA: hypothetical protein VFH38_07070 [Jatrophihabitans sp.]|nr:hypothetical protein [Jatrophihabitans sp.]
MTAWSRTGVVPVELTDDAAVPAPASGLMLGSGRGAPVALRLFRSQGTRLIVAGDPLPAQLLALRAASAGTPVHVITAVSALWEQVVAHGPGHRVQQPGETRPAVVGAALVVHDHPTRSRADVRPWQCRVDVRSGWSAADLGSFTAADLTVFGRVSSETSLRIAALYGLAPRATEAMTGLLPRGAALVRPGRIEYVELQLSPAEAQLLERARRQLAATRIAP